jgi:hypothetical protein
VRGVLGFSLGQLPGGRLVMAGGSAGRGETRTAAAFEWAPGRAAWTPLPPMGVARAYAVAAVLSAAGGRMLVAGGTSDDGDELFTFFF